MILGGIFGGVGAIAKIVKAANQPKQVPSVAISNPIDVQAAMQPVAKISPHGESVGFKNFRQLKKHLGSPGEGMEWHHIVEQSQLKKSGFSAHQIHNTNNIIAVNKGTHGKISGRFTTKISDTGPSLRNYLAGKSYAFQYHEGIRVLKMFGVL